MKAYRPRWYGRYCERRKNVEIVKDGKGDRGGKNSMKWVKRILEEI